MTLGGPIRDTLAPHVLLLAHVVLERVGDIEELRFRHDDLQLPTPMPRATGASTSFLTILHDGRTRPGSRPTRLPSPTASAAASFAAVAQQSLRLLWPALPRQVIRNANDDIAQAPPSGHGDHVTRQLLAEAHAGIEAAGNDVHPRGIADQLERHIRIDFEECSRPRGEDELNGWCRRIDPHAAGRLVPEWPRSQALE
jgi:hypothetical protein